MTRDPRVQTFITHLKDALTRRHLEPAAAIARSKIFAALETVQPAGSLPPHRLPVCGHLAEALAATRSHSPELNRLAESLAALEPMLSWAPRASGGASASANWPDGHANARIVGGNGLEPRNDVQIGVSLLAPHVRYPDHSHPPEEIYLVLSPGRFQHGGSDWFSPGFGGTLYNEPNIIHAMASDGAPLLAIWSLWSEV